MTPLLLVDPTLFGFKLDCWRWQMRWPPFCFVWKLWATKINQTTSFSKRCWAVASQEDWTSLLLKELQNQPPRTPPTRQRWDYEEVSAEQESCHAMNIQQSCSLLVNKTNCVFCLFTVELQLKQISFKTTNLKNNIFLSSLFTICVINTFNQTSSKCSTHGIKLN